MFNNILLFVVITIAMAGCAETKIEAPVDPALASATKLTFPIFSAKWENGNVQLATKNKNACGDFSTNILPRSSDKDFTVTVEGGKDIFFHVSRSDAQVECNEFGIFYAAKGMEYMLNIEKIDQSCAISLIEKAPNGTKNKVRTYPAHASKSDGVRVCENKDKL